MLDAQYLSKALILTEAGEGIGFGHYTRCSAIQSYLIELGVVCEMMLNIKGDYELSIKQGRQLDWLSAKGELLNLYQHYSVVLIDSYLASSADYTWIRQNFKKVISLDDYNRIIYNVDIIINPNVFASIINYSNQTCSDIFGGKDFVILRNVFRKKGKRQIRLSQKINSIVVTVGGSDYRNILPEIITILKNYKEFKIFVISGNTAIQKKLQNEFHKITILGLLTAEEMYAYFAKADLVISACGQTLHELASMGKPTIGICLDIDQEPNQQFYFENGFLTTKIQYEDLSLIKEQILLLSDIKTREKVSGIGLSLINKWGVKNIGDLLINEVDARVIKG